MNYTNLSTFDEATLHHYLLTLQLRINDLKAFNIELGRENIELAQKYQGLVIQKKKMHQQKLKKQGASGWFAKGKQKLGSFWRKNKEEDEPQTVVIPSKEYNNTHQVQERYIEPLPVPLGPQHHYLPQFDPTQFNPSNQPFPHIPAPPSKQEGINAENFDFDDLFKAGRSKIANIISNKSTQITQIVKKYIGGKKEEDLAEPKSDRKQNQIQEVNVGQNSNNQQESQSKEQEQHQKDEVDEVLNEYQIVDDAEQPQKSISDEHQRSGSFQQDKPSKLQNLQNDLKQSKHLQNNENMTNSEDQPAQVHEQFHQNSTQPTQPQKKQTKKQESPIRQLQKQQNDVKQQKDVKSQDDAPKSEDDAPNDESNGI